MYNLEAQCCNGCWEELESCLTQTELYHLTNEYRLAFGAGWHFRGRSNRTGETFSV